MAFISKDSIIFQTEHQFDVVSARLYLSYTSALSYKNAKVITTFQQSVQDEPPDEASHYVSGYVMETTVPVTRVVNIHRSDTGELVGSTTSSGIGGYFYVTTTYSGSHYVICLDDESGVDYNYLIYGKIYPITISG